MEVWILVNNRAGRQHARENGEQVRRVFALGGARARVAYTDTVEEGAAFLQQAAEAQPDLLVCCGGDGTLSQALNVLQQLEASRGCWIWAALGSGSSCTWPPLGPLPSLPTKRRPR